MSLLRKFDVAVTSARVPAWLLVLLGVLSTAVPAQAQAAKEQPSTYDRIWTNFTQWYKNDDNPAVQQVLFTGRFQHDFATVSADQGDHDESNIRRVRAIARRL